MDYMRTGLSVLLVAVLVLKAADIQQPFDAIINLGGDCQVAYQLYIHGLRAYALPFDALITPYDALYKMLENRCVGFMAPDNFVVVTSQKDGNYIVDQTYGTRLLHDFKLDEDFLIDYPQVAAKYTRRIERLFGLIEESVYPLFIRKRISRYQALELHLLLSTLRRGKPCVLLVLDGTDEMRDDWKIDGVKNYYLRQPEPYVWKGDAQAWQDIFNDMGLPITDSEHSCHER